MLFSLILLTFLFCRLIEDCIEIEKIREESRLKRIKEDDERSDADNDGNFDFEDSSNAVTNGVKDSGQEITANSTGDD